MAHAYHVSPWNPGASLDFTVNTRSFVQGCLSETQSEEEDRKEGQAEKEEEGEGDKGRHKGGERMRMSKQCWGRGRRKQESDECFLDSKKKYYNIKKEKTKYFILLYVICL